MPLIHSAPISSIVIAGAGGFGLELYDYLHEEALQGGPTVSGFLDDAPSTKTSNDMGVPYLGTIGDFRPQEGQVVVVAIGSVKGREVVLSKLAANGVHMPRYFHSSAIVSSSAQIDDAVLICPYSIVNRNASLAYGAVANVHCSVGHGASVGKFSILSPYAALNGDASIGDRCFLGTRATIYPRIHIESDCIVDTHTGVRRNAEDRKIISSRGTYRVDTIRFS